VACLLTGRLGTVLLAPPIPRVGKKKLLAEKTLVGQRSFHPAIFLAASENVTHIQRQEQPTTGRKWCILTWEN
jgi:hypothetical protein